MQSTPLFNREAERSVLGATLVRPEVLEQVADLIDSNVQCSLEAL